MSSVIESVGARERASLLSELVPPLASVYVQCLGGLSVDALDLSEIRQSSAESGGVDNGIQELYYAGRAAWQVLAREMDYESVTAELDDRQQSVVASYTFNATVPRLVNGFLQSSLSVPTILSAWYRIAGTDVRRDGLSWNMYHGVRREDVVGQLESDWMTDMLRQASTVNSGLYRNSTGIAMDYRRFVGRSIQSPLKKFLLACPEGTSLPVERVVGEAGEYGVLSAGFRKFLSNSLRSHNAQVRDDSGEPLYEGTSQGCPFAHRTHLVSEDAYINKSIFDISKSPVEGKQKVKLKLDLFELTAKFLANVLRSL